MSSNNNQTSSRWKYAFNKAVTLVVLPALPFAVLIPWIIIFAPQQLPVLLSGLFFLVVFPLLFATGLIKMILDMADDWKNNAIP